MEILKIILGTIKSKCGCKESENTPDNIVYEMNQRLDQAEKHLLGRAQLDGDDRICIFKRPPNGGCDS
jgi:hypothetical protein